MEMLVKRAAEPQAADAWILLEAYDLEVGVVEKDTPESVGGWLARPDSGLWIAYVDGMPGGCVVLRPLEKFRLSGECKRLYVRPLFRRRGVAEALLDAMEIYAVRAL